MFWYSPERVLQSLPEDSAVFLPNYYRARRKFQKHENINLIARKLTCPVRLAHTWMELFQRLLRIARGIDDVVMSVVLVYFGLVELIAMHTSANSNSCSPEEECNVVVIEPPRDSILFWISNRFLFSEEEKTNLMPFVFRVIDSSWKHQQVVALLGSAKADVEAMKADS